jgi:histidinol dehydrogenase
MIPLLRLSRPDDAARVGAIIARLRLDPRDLASAGGHRAEASAVVQKQLADVAARGDAALVEIARQFDDPGFTKDRLRVTVDDMAAAASRISPALRAALERSIDQVREYQSHVLPTPPTPLRRGGVELGMKFSPIDSAGVYFPGGKAAYPSSLIMLAVPAQVARVGRIAVVTPASAFGQSDVVLAAAHLSGVSEMYRCGGAAAIGALAFGTETIPAVDKIVGPGNAYVQLAKRFVSGGVGIDGFLGPSEILTLADDTAEARFVAADLIAQAEHDPGSCFLLTTSDALATRGADEITAQIRLLPRAAAIERALREDSMIVLGDSLERLIDLANAVACEHVNLQTRDDDLVLTKLRHAGAIYVGRYSPVAAGDYVAGPSHCLPTNTTARFASGISVYEFFKRTSVVRYTQTGIGDDTPAIMQIAEAEGLGAHAASVRVRGENR